jgi:glyoxylase-like metal-dependent hydrolase (beta-lactamase superfamily II)
MISRSLLLLAAVPLSYLILRLLLLHEEKRVKTYLGGEYTEYAKRVSAVIPKPSLVKRAFFYPDPTRRCTANLYIIQSGDANLFLYTDGNEYICIDAGYKGTGTADALQNLGIEPSGVSALFLTHTDHDHVGGLDLFDRAAVYLGEKEEPLITGEKKRFPLIYSNKPLSREYTLLKDGERVRVGSTTVEAIETPGHTIGHLSYLMDGRYLFTGDAILFQNGVIRPFYRVLSMCHKKTKESAEKIKLIKHIDYICTAHSGVFRPDSIRDG